jgi:hypothetical protein
MISPTDSEDEAGEHEGDATQGADGNDDDDEDDGEEEQSGEDDDEGEGEVEEEQEEDSEEEEEGVRYPRNCSVPLHLGYTDRALFFI